MNSKAPNDSVSQEAPLNKGPLRIGFAAKTRRVVAGGIGASHTERRFYVNEESAQLFARLASPTPAPAKKPKPSRGLSKAERAEWLAQQVSPSTGKHQEGGE